MSKSRYIIVTSIVCIIALSLSGCFNYDRVGYAFELEEKLVSEEAIYEDESGTYQIKFHQIPIFDYDVCDYVIRGGGTWYDKDGQKELFTFVFGGNEPLTLEIYSEEKDEILEIMDWNYGENDSIIMYGFCDVSDREFGKKVEAIIDQTYVFYRCNE